MSDRIENLIRTQVERLGLDLDAVEMKETVGQRMLRVVIDAAAGVTVDDVAQVSRELSAALDTSDAMGEARYTLEVTSRGLSRPLELPRHWERNVDRLVSIKFRDGTKVTGRIMAADDSGANVNTPQGLRRIEFGDVSTAKITPELNRRKDV